MKAQKKSISTQIPTDEDVTFAYRLFFDREPESQVAIDHKKSLGSLMALRHECLLSPEFKEKNKEIKLLGYSGNEPALNIEFDCNLQALFDHVRQTWEHLGSTEPHWSVLSAEAFRGERLKANMDAFKAAGQTDT